MANKIGILTRRKLKQFLFDRGIVALNKDRYETGCAALVRAVTMLVEQDNSTKEAGATGIVFSKDRPLQLYGLLKSYFENSRHPPPLIAIINTSTPEYKKAYSEVESLLDRSQVRFVEESSFHDSLVDNLSAVGTEKVFFLVDDIVFIRPVDFSAFFGFDTSKYVPSLRLAPHLSRSYTMLSSQPLPQFKEISAVPDQEVFLSWKWSEGLYDWGYALSVDGHCFNTKEILAMSQLVEFKAPNSYEVALQWFKNIFLEREGVCYKKSRIVNLPFNKVQIENNNISGNISSEKFLEFWQSGKEIDIKHYQNLINRSAHQEVELFLKQRE